MFPVTTSAILLRAHPYSESSRVLRFYTQELGLVGVMARGVRKGASKGRGSPGTFGEGVARIVVRESRELQTLREFTPVKTRFGLAGDFRRLAGASIAAELVLRHAGQDPHAQLYQALSEGLDRLEAAAPADVHGEILALGWKMVQALGFGPELRSCTACGEVLEEGDMGRFDLAAGGVSGPECRAPSGSRRIGPLARVQLRCLLGGTVPPGLRGTRAHLSLLDDFATYHMLGGRRLDSFRFLDPPARTAPDELPAD
ncbi:MAG: DNA repair protein RecO [Gemmatimonadota bacterium]|nr:DNA repair protein RecO [Gemmatimonadota bacterium]MDE2986068.1 DNA repair protein RecO [Gemmatimonadota bacterium]